MTLPKGPVLTIREAMQKRHTETLKARMPNDIFILSDPLLKEEELDPRDLNDATAIYDRIISIKGLYDAAITLGINRPEAYPYQCQVSRRSVPYVEGGPAPADDYSDIWDVIIPGGVDDAVRVSKVAIVEQDHLLGLKRVYTITGVGQDHLKYIARLTMEDYGLRRP